MINKVKGLISHPLFSGSAMMIVGSNISSFLAYIYHLIIGRLLGPVLYGELAAVLSLIGIFTASFAFLGLVVIKFVSAAKEDEIQPLFSWFSKKVLVIGIIIALLVFLSMPFLSRFLHIRYSILVLLVPIFLLAVLSFLYSSFLQGLLRFKQVVIATNLGTLSRLILGVVFVYLGFSVFGAVLGFLLSVAGGLFLLRFFLKEFRFSGNKKVFKGGKKVLGYSVPVFFSSISIFSLFSTDVILVKHFFEAHDAGIYAALSTLGKVIFYGAAPVVSVMFPMISQRRSRGQGYRKIFMLSLALTSVIATGVLFIYWLLPELSIKILYGDEFLQAAPNLIWFGLFMTIFTLSSLILNFFLSREITKVVSFVAIAAIIQAMGIWFFHDSIFMVIKVSIISVSLLFGSLLIYFGYETSKRKTG
jgi:O-antigen/teichoic acid export membrane protein